MPVDLENKSPTPKKPRPSPVPNQSTWLLLVAVAIVLTFIFYSNKANNRSEISYGMFRSQLEQHNIESVEIQESRVIGEFKKEPTDPDAKAEAGAAPPLLKKKFETTLPPMARSDPALDHYLREQLDGKYSASEPADNTFWVMAFPVLVLMAVFAVLWFMFRKARDSFFTGGLTGGFTKSGARRYEIGDRPITFADVAGLEGVKNELQIGRAHV
jgi:cell division protease FtsH